MVAKIAVSAASFAIDKPYSYWAPDGMTLSPGMRVMIPFGRSNKHCEGIVLSVEPGSPEGLKAVERALDDAPVLDMTMLRLAGFMRERYFCTLYDAVKAMLPGGLGFQTTERFELTEDKSWQGKTLRQPDAMKILSLLADLGGQGSGQILRQAVPDEEAFSAAVQYLARKKWIHTTVDLRRRTSDKTEQVASLASSAEEARDYATRRPKSAAMQKAVLKLLCDLGSVSVKELCYFTGASAATVRRLRDLGYVRLEDREVFRYRQIKPAQVDTNILLNEEQSAAFDGLRTQMEQEQPGVALLYGVTGSGKTSVYLRLIRQCLERGSAAMLLVPEIALTPQLLGLLVAHFGENVAVLHSSLPAAERYDQWKRVRSGRAKVVVGTRSAIFAPCAPGLIILDEEQEHSYKSENSPCYHAREVAIWRGVKEGALVLLGSATPSIETMYHAKQGHYRLYCLKARFNQRPLPEVRIVDMREEIKDGNDLSFSLPLQEAIQDTAQAGKQTILFLNRRGNSRALVCVDCRQAPECPRCSARLTYHSANERIMCHYCGFSRPVPQRCPSCGGALKRVGLGTQKAQQELNVIFPDYEIARMDADTVSAVNTHEKILDRFKRENIPVLIGTQMVAKGLDLPNVTLVGVMDGDLSLYSGSYRAAETTFNMLTQVVGRAGRGVDPGTAIIQTLVPEHEVLKLAARQDHQGFYDLEIGLRQMQGFPPFGDVITVTFTGQQEQQVLQGAEKFRDSLIACLKEPAYASEKCTVLGPAPCSVPKINYNFRFQLTLRCRQSKALRELVAHFLRLFAKDKANRGVSAFADVNGME